MLGAAARLAGQQRPLYCYLLMSLWIFLLVAGMYRYIITVENIKTPKQVIRRDSHRDNFRGDFKLKKIIHKFCNAPEIIRLDSEALIKDNMWSLQGVITIIRHGDRGPLTHIKDIEGVNCDAPNPTALLQRYQEYISNATGAGRAPWAQSPGPFHNFPLLPLPPTTACHLGQLTIVGIQQLLTMGTLLGKVYSEKFGWNVNFNNTNRFTVDKKLKHDTNKNRTDVTKNPVEENGKTKESDKKSKIDLKISKGLPLKEDGVVNAKMQIGKPTDGDIVVHSTRYRRALQSALALIWAMLGGGSGVGGAIAYESPSLAFCSTDCACPAADKFAKTLSHELKARLEAHPAIGELVVSLSKVVSQSPSQISSDPHILEDALLAYLCHSAPLPCVEKPIEPPKLIKKNGDNKQNVLNTVDNKLHNAATVQKQKSRRLLSNLQSVDLYNSFHEEYSRKVKSTRMRIFDTRPKVVPLDFDSQMEKEKLGYYQQKLLENADSNYQDVVLVKRNMDGDFNFNGDAPNIPEPQDTNDSDDYEEKEDENRKKGVNTETLCVRKDQVTGLFAYTDWEMKQSVRSKNLKKVSILRGYGMIRHIVKYILQMISEGKPKFVLYSGHDKTLQYLHLALGLSSDIHIQYASRMIIEVYKYVNVNMFAKTQKSRPNGGHAPLDFYFRLLLNGQDVTNQLSFCKGKIYVASEGEGKNIKAYLCKIENIIRFIHEDYFAMFNATNFKDACAVH